MTQRDVKNQLLHGSLAAMSRVVLAIPVYMLVTPFVLQYLGAEQFAVWSLSASLLGLLNLADFGLKNSVVYHCARTQGDIGAVARLLSTALTLHLVLAVVVLAGVLSALPLLVKVFAISDRLLDPARFIFVVTAIGFAVRLLSMPIQGLIESQRGVGVTQWILLAWMLFNAVGTMVALRISASLYSVGIIAVLGNVFIAAAFFAYGYRYVGMRLRLGSFASGEAKTLLGYGSGLALAAIAIAFREPLLKMMVSHQYGLAAVADFDIAYRLCVQIASAAMSPLLGAFAAAAVLSANPKAMVEVLRPLQAYLLLALMPAVVLALTTAEPLTRLWLGQSSNVASMLPWMVGAFALYYSTEIQYQALQASGMSRYAAVMQAANLAICILMLWWLRDVDVALAVGASLLCSFGLAAVANRIVFARRFSALTLISIVQWASVLAPALAMVVFSRAVALDGKAMVVSLAFYAVAHLSLTAMSGLWRPQRLLNWALRRPRAEPVVE